MFIREDRIYFLSIGPVIEHKPPLVNWGSKLVQASRFHVCLDPPFTPKDLIGTANLANRANLEEP